MEQHLHNCGDRHIMLTEPADEIPCWWRPDDATRDTTCLWCGVSLDPALPCLRFQSINAEGVEERAYCCLTDAYHLLDAIIQHSPPASLSIETDGGTVRCALMYEQRGWLQTTKPCLWCEETIKTSDAAYAIHVSGVAVHESCGTPMATAVQDALDSAIATHADEMLGALL